MMDRTRFEIGLFIGIVLLAVASRFWLMDYPNFKPVAALALFGGLLFRRIVVGIVAIVAAMMISNLSMGGCEWQIALAVYLSLALAVVAGNAMRRFVDMRSQGTASTCQRGMSFVAASLLMATTFFVLTNLATWYCWYPADWSGLASCFTAAVPFFRWTLAGDVTFVVAFAAAYEVGLRWVYSSQTDEAAFKRVKALDR